jgi:hypothetical protein
MPRQVFEFRVVVASPADVFDCREAVLTAINEISRIFESRKIAIRGLNWEEYASPGIDAEPQAVINRQLLRDYDILIAIFGTKLGSPTANFRSGTIEELEHALGDKDNPMAIDRAHVYFRDKIDSLSRVSADDLRQVENYRDELKTRGVLFRTFNGNEELQREVRVNIQRAVTKFLERQSTTGLNKDHGSTADSKTNGLSMPLAISEPNETDEFGVLDYMERAEEAGKKLADSMASMNSLIEEIGAETQRRVEKVEQLFAPGIPASTKKSNINEFADFLKLKAVALRAEAELAKNNSSIFIENMIMALNMERETSEPEQYKRNRDSLLTEAETMLRQISANKLIFVNFRHSVEVIPRVTIQFNQAKKLLVGALDECLEFHSQVERSLFELGARS